MTILFDASILNVAHVGIAKTLLYLYRSIYSQYPDFKAYGFNCNMGDYSDCGIYLLGNKSEEELLDFSKRNNIKIVHYPANFVTCKHLKGLKTVLTIHDLIPLEKEFKSSSWQKIKYRLKTYYSVFKADYVTTVSEYSASQIKLFTCNMIHPKVIYWGVTLPFLSNLKKRQSEQYFLYVGGYDKRKGIDKLVKAYMTMRTNKLTNCKLIITGRIHHLDEETDEMIRNGTDAGWIIQTGYITDEQLCLLYSNAVCSVYLSQSEGFGLPLIEAMLYNCPVVTTRFTSLPEIGRDAVCYVNRENQTEIIELLLKLEQDSQYRKKMVEAEQRRIKDFHWEDTAKSFWKVLEHCSV